MLCFITLHSTNMIYNSFIQNLQKKIDETAIYTPTGKYGKNELDEWETSEAKLKVLLSSNPKTIENIVAYVQYIESLGVLKNQKIYKKVCAMLKSVEINDSDGKLAIAHEIVQEYEKEMKVKKLKGYIKLSIIAIPLVIWYFSFVMFWGFGWQLVWFVIAFIILRIGYEHIDELDKNKDINYNPFL